MTPPTAGPRPGTVSVIIPAYKAERTICRAIDSVLNQTVPPMEIIVIDDGSPDNQNSRIQEYGDSVVLIQQPNGRTACARNTGLARARGDFIAFLDADDYWEPEKLGRQLAVFEKHPEVGVVAGAYFTQEPGRERASGGSHHRSWNDRVLRVNGERAFQLAAMMWTGTLIVRREIVGEERFASGLEPAEDRDMWIRFVLRGPVYLLSEPLSTAVLEPGSISRHDVDRDCSMMLETINRHRNTLGLLGTMKWRSHTFYRWAATESETLPALSLLCRSFLCWPLPYPDLHGMRSLGRLKRLAVLMRLRTPKRRLAVGRSAS